jgi:hypothetical protein
MQPVHVAFYRDQCRAWAMAGPGFGHRSLVAVATLAAAVTIV